MSTEPSRTIRKKRPFAAGWCLAAVWLAAVLAGFAVVVEFDLTPGEAGTAPNTRPAGLAPPHATNRPVLVLFAHPRCPCTRATLVELNHILTACPGAADVRVYFRTPADPSDEWTRTVLWHDAAELPNTTVIGDAEGAVAERCRVKTSGHVLLYAADGRLLFSGGITGARGEEGVNPGRSAVVALLKGQSGPGGVSPVFGCPLFDSAF